MGNIEIQYKKLADIKPYEKNPRKNDDAVEYVMNSIREFGFKVPIVIDREGVIVAGHTRYKAAKKLRMKETPCIIADDLSDEQIKAFRLADNKVAEKAEWDFELLNDELENILNFDMTDFGFDSLLEEAKANDFLNKGNGSLAESFLAPPYSIFDARQGYWQDRKNSWKKLGINSEVGREEDLLGKGLHDLAQRAGSTLSGTSIFDPVLCEILYRWFCPENGKIFDCFAGGSVRGIVADILGYKYTGIDLRQEQIDANIENANKLNCSPTWYCDDSLNADKYVEDNSCDMIFSCPPYADLEVYSEDPRDISNMEYEDFLKVYSDIIKIALRKLKDDRFAVFVVGDIRDKRGFYRDFLSDTKRIFAQNAANLYNEIIYIESGAMAPLRARKSFTTYRKVVKMNQNVLVFFKGNPKSIKDNYGEVEIADIEETEEDEFI